MSKLFIASVMAMMPFIVSGQTSQSPGIDKEIFNICATIVALALFMIFTLAIIRRILEYRLRNRIIEQGMPEHLVQTVLKTTVREDRNVNIKWFAVLAGFGVGLTVIHYSQPLGIHSLAIMAFSLSFSFLGYFFFINKATS